MHLASGTTWAYDRLVVSPGVDFMYDRSQGMSAEATDRIPHAWKAGAQTVLLRRQLEAMPDGGVVVMSVPLAPYRCPPGPYERACQIAWYLKARKPKSKLIVLDANPQVISKGRCSRASGRRTTPMSLDYRPNAKVTEVDVPGKTFVLETGERVKGDVLNLIPPMRAGDIARASRLVTANERWCEVDWTTMESVAVKNVHVLGDATLSAPGMPKSGHMANQHGKAAAAAIVEIFNGRASRAADDGQHLLQLRRRSAGDPRVVGASLRRGQEDARAGDRRRRRVGPRWRALGDRRKLRVRLGADDLGGHLVLNRSLRRSTKVFGRTNHEQQPSGWVAGLLRGCVPGILAVAVSATQAQDVLQVEAGKLFGRLEVETFVESPKTKLGRALFWDARLSAVGKTACASCHAAADAGADRRRASIDARGKPTSRQSPTVFNSISQPMLRWLGDRRSGADQAEGSIAGSMGFAAKEDILPVLRTLGYEAAFHAAFPNEAEPMTHATMGARSRPTRRR